MTSREDERRKPQQIWQIKPGVYATPYGWIDIDRGGKSVSFHLYSDMRASAHDRALLSVVMQLHRGGVEQINVDHLDLPFLDKALTLVRANRRLDFVYYANRTLHECELLSRRQVGLESTCEKIRDLLNWCTTLEIWIPKKEEVNAHEVLTIAGLFGKVQVITYEEVE